MDASNNEIAGGEQDYGMRIYDPRLGRFLSVDPLTAKYPELTPYQFASNTPIQATDLDGEEQRYYLLNLQSQHPTLTLTKQEDCWKIFDKVVVKVTGLPQNNYAVYTFTPWGAGRSGGVPGSGSGNYIEDFDKDFKKDPVKAIASGEYVPNEQILKDMVKDVALTIILHKVMSSNTVKPNPNTEPEIENSSVKGAKHHIATDKNTVSTARGGPWTPRFQKIFNNAGLKISTAPENLVEVINHYGPHPEEYHQLVLDRLNGATRGLAANTPEYKAAVTNTLKAIGNEAQTKGTVVNKLLTEK